ncbi:MAG: methyltransferase domain-containing protein [Nanoarchaeota archaeon]
MVNLGHDYLSVNEQTYDKLAQEYDQRAGQYGETQKAILRPLVSRLHHEFGLGPRSVLDIGCGVGLNLATMDFFGFKTTGLDLSEEMTRYAEKRSPRSRLIVGALGDAVVDGRYHGVILDAVIHCFPKDEALRILEFVKGYMYPGTVGTISTSYSAESREGFFGKEDYPGSEPRFRKYWTPEELEEALRQSGFDILDAKRESNYGKDWFRVFFQNPATDALDHVLYICGPHATGKSTLTNALAAREPFVLHPRSGHSTSDDFLERLKYRIHIYQKDALDQIVLSSEGTERIILGDRAIFDGLAYVDTFSDLGWIDEDGHRQCYELFDEFFPASLMPKNIVHVNPPLDWNMQRMHERWASEGVRWKEDDPRLLPAAMKRFTERYGSLNADYPTIQVLDLRTTDRDERVSRVLDWTRQLDTLGGLMK